MGVISRCTICKNRKVDKEVRIMRKNIKEVIKNKYEELEEELVNCDESDIKAIVHTQETLLEILKEAS